MNVSVKFLGPVQEPDPILTKELAAKGVAHHALEITATTKDGAPVKGFEPKRLRVRVAHAGLAAYIGTTVAKQCELAAQACGDRRVELDGGPPMPVPHQKTRAVLSQVTAMKFSQQFPAEAAPSAAVGKE